MKKPAYLGLSMPELNKILMYEFWYYFIKPKYGKKAKLCYMGTDSFIAYIKTDDIYRNIADDVETRFVISNYELECNSIERPLRKRKKEKFIEWMKDELDGKIMIKFVGLRAEYYGYLIDDDSEEKKQKAQRSVS